MSYWKASQPQSQQQSKVDAFQQKQSSSISSASSTTQAGWTNTTQGQHNKSWNAPNVTQQYSAGSHPYTARQTPNQEVVKAKYGTDVKADIYRQAHYSSAETKQPKDLDTRIDQSRQDDSTDQEGKHEDRLDYGSHWQPEKQRENPGDDSKASNAAISGPLPKASRQSGTLTPGWQQKGLTKQELAFSSKASNNTNVEPSTDVSRQADIITSGRDQKDRTKQSILPASDVKPSTISNETGTLTDWERKDPRQHELTSHASIHKPSTKVSTEMDTFNSDRKRKDTRQPELTLHAAVAKPSTEIDIFAPDRERKELRQQELTSYPKPPTFASEQFETGRERKDSRKQAIVPNPSTMAPAQVGNLLSDTEGEHPKNQQHTAAPKPLIATTQADGVTPDSKGSRPMKDSQGTPEASPSPLPPPPRTSFISGKKKKTFGKFFGKRQEKPSNETLSEKNFAKPGQSETTSVSLAMKDLSEDQVIIAIMGPTGSGKSSFIGTATKSDVGVGHELQSCTTEINMVKLNWVDSYETTDFDIVFVDTPGFDDTNKSDVEILEMLADWLHKTYESKITLAGILYFHRISDNRMAGTPLKNLRMFRELCGKKALENIILVTTMWDEVEENVGTEREKELRGKYWKAMIDQGSATARYQGTIESAWDIVEHFTTQRQAVLLQKEMVDLKKQLPETNAGRELYMALEVLVRKQADILQKIRAETKRHEDGQDPKILHALQAECEAIRQQLHTTMKEMQVLKLPLGKRLSRLVWTPIGFKGNKSR